MCDAENGAVAAIVARGYHCTSCGAWPNSTWWYRAERRRDVELGDTFDRYRIVERSDRDEMTTTYVAERLDLARRVSLVVYQPWLANNPEFLDQFARVNALQQVVRGTQLVEVDRAGQTAGVRFVATVPDTTPTLASLLGRDLEWQCALGIVQRLCDVFGAARQAGIMARVHPAKIHVTLHPQRVATDGDPYRTAPTHTELGEVRIDLYATCLSRRWLIAETEIGVARPPGVLDYMPPEEIMGRPCGGTRDVYALGLLAYQLTTGREAFADATDLASLITAQQHPVRPPSKLAPQLPPEVDALISHCLQKDRHLRFPTLETLAAAIAQLSS